MDATQPTQGRSATGAWTTALVVLLLFCASAVVTACGAADTTTSNASSPSSSAVAAAAASPSVIPLPTGAARGTIAFTRVLYDRNSTLPPFDIYVVRSDGSGLRRLAVGARGPAWSPDGARIAYTSLSARGGVWVMNADGSGKRRVTPAPGGAEWVAWSPDGRQILFCSSAFGGDEILVVVNSDGSHLKTVLTSSSGFMGYTPAWAPDGSILFGWRSGNLGEIRSLLPDGRGLTVVTATARPSRSSSFSLSRDGKWLAIWDGDSDRLLRLAADGSGMAVAIVDEVSQYQGGTILSSWSSGGGQLVLGRDSRAWLAPGSVLHVAKADGSDVWEVPNTKDAYDPAWRPE